MIIDALDNYQLLQKRIAISVRQVNLGVQSCTKGCIPDAELLSQMESNTPTHLREK